MIELDLLVDLTEDLRAAAHMPTCRCCAASLTGGRAQALAPRSLLAPASRLRSGSASSIASSTVASALRSAGRTVNGADGASASGVRLGGDAGRGDGRRPRRRGHRRDQPRAADGTRHGQWGRRRRGRQPVSTIWRAPSCHGRGAGGHSAACCSANAVRSTARAPA